MDQAPAKNEQETIRDFLPGGEGDLSFDIKNISTGLKSVKIDGESVSIALKGISKEVFQRLLERHSSQKVTDISFWGYGLENALLAGLKLTKLITVQEMTFIDCELHFIRSVHQQPSPTASS